MEPSRSQSVSHRPNPATAVALNASDAIRGSLKMYLTRCKGETRASTSAGTGPRAGCELFRAQSSLMQTLYLKDSFDAAPLCLQCSPPPPLPPLPPALPTASQQHAHPACTANRELAACAQPDVVGSSCHIGSINGALLVCTAEPAGTLLLWCPAASYQWFIAVSLQAAGRCRVGLGQAALSSGCATGLCCGYKQL